MLGPSPPLSPTTQIVAHSVGTWCAYELLRLVQQHGLPMPAKAFLSGGCGGEGGCPHAFCSWLVARGAGSAPETFSSGSALCCGSVTHATKGASPSAVL